MVTVSSLLETVLEAQQPVEGFLPVFANHGRFSQKESQQSVIAGSLFWDFFNLEVGMIGFEPTASCSQSRRATKLRYIPSSLNYHNILSMGSTTNLSK
jgi:hypothetical protein